MSRLLAFILRRDPYGINAALKERAWLRKNGWERRPKKLSHRSRES